MNLDLVKLGKAASAMLLAAAMAGCGGSGPTLIVPPTEVNLNGSMDLTAGDRPLAAGETVEIGRTTIECQGDEACTLTVTQAPVTGEFMATSTGGTVRVTVAMPMSLPLPLGHEVPAGEEVTVQPGGTKTFGQTTTVTCPMGGAACELMVDASAEASYYGGRPEVMVTPTPFGDLPLGHKLPAGSRAPLPPGGEETVDGTTITCPMGGAACQLMVSADGMASYYGGRPMVTVAATSWGTLPLGHELGMNWGVTLEPGDDEMVNQTTVMCPADSPTACELIVSAGVASYRGVKPMVTVTPTSYGTLPLGHELTDEAWDDRTLEPGGNAMVGQTTVRCPTGGAACQLMVSAAGEASYVGVKPMVTVTPTPWMGDLPPGHMLQPGQSVVINDPNGGSRRLGRTTITCVAACEFMTTQGDDGVVAKFRGVRPKVDPIPYPVALPMEHSLVPGMFPVPANGGSVMRGGVEFTCPGDVECVITITAGGMASSTGGQAMAMQVDPRGYQAFRELSDAIINPRELNDLQTNLYHMMGVGGGVTSSVTTHEDPVPGMDPNVRGVSDIAVTVMADGDDPTRDDDNADLDVIAPDYGPRANAPDPFNSPGTRVARQPAGYPNPPGIVEYPNGPGMAVLDIAEPVLANDASRWDSDISVMADWDLNPAAEWQAPQPPDNSLPGGANLVNPSLVDWDMADDRRRLAGRAQPANIWTHYFQWVDPNLPGGRTLELDLRSDFVAGHANFWMPGQTQLPRDFPPIIARGAGGTFDEVTVDWDDVMGDFNGDGVMNSGVNEIPRGGAIDLSYVDWADMDDMNGMSGDMGVEGTYQGVRGRFVCIDGGAAGGGPYAATRGGAGPTSGTNQGTASGTGGDGGTGDSECDVDHQTPGRLGISKDDLLVFLPYVHGDDPNWLAAGVWLTIPDDLREGDYAIGAFVYGNDPVTRLNRLLIDDRLWDETATYRGQAFGRYAEDMGGADDGAKTLGRFTADAVLTATFSKGGTTGNNPWDRAEDRWRELYPYPVQLPPTQGGGTGLLNPDLGEEMELPVGMIQGDLTGFETDDNGNGVFEARANWDVNFEETPIEIDMAYSPPPTSNPNPPNNPNLSLGRWRIAPEAMLRFDAPASGHAGTPDDIGGGHALTGYWNGLFYGDPNNMDNDNNPLV